MLLSLLYSYLIFLLPFYPLDCVEHVLQASSIHVNRLVLLFIVQGRGDISVIDMGEVVCQSGDYDTMTLFVTFLSDETTLVSDL